MAPSKVIEFEHPLIATTSAPARPRVATRHDTREGRFYMIDGEKYPSVTTILKAIDKPALIAWAANLERALVMEAAADLYADAVALPHQLPRAGYVLSLEQRLGTVKAHQKARDKAADIGTETHALIEWWLRKGLGQVVGPEPAVSDPAQWGFMAWQDWAKSVDLVPLFIEQVLYSRAHNYAGTMDLLALVKGRETVVDVKTGKAVYPEAGLQNVAYRAALVEMGHVEAMPAGVIVRVPKRTDDPAFEAVDVDQSFGTVDALMPVFHATRTVWNWTEQGAQQRKRAHKKTPAAVAVVSVPHHGTTPIAPRAPLTHHVWWDLPGERGLVTVCEQAYIDRTQSVQQPTCPECAARLAAHDGQTECPF